MAFMAFITLLRQESSRAQTSSLLDACSNHTRSPGCAGLPLLWRLLLEATRRGRLTQQATRTKPSLHYDVSARRIAWQHAGVQGRENCPRHRPEAREGAPEAAKAFGAMSRAFDEYAAAA
jgi:hypothetical protein